MTNLVVALQAEARPIIEALDLVQDRPGPGMFPVYCNGGLSLVVSGIGRAYCAAAVMHLFHRTAQRADQAWLNIGIAGHQQVPIGSVLLASRITERASGRCWYPPYVLDVGLLRSPLVTVDEPERCYPQCCAYDMEASSFYQIASRCSTGELVQSLKIISDNPGSNLDLTADQISQLLADQMSAIESAVGQLADLSRVLDTVRTPPGCRPFILNNGILRWHSVTSSPLY
ncbi:MAG: hypothetical protein Ct9H300mP14_11760 [Gammaproteobacteria bacterium]|nr:MAG: hypothetical protein Ct9H300mP14_11760 [Gammaproteobacteria bacterium]